MNNVVSALKTGPARSSTTNLQGLWSILAHRLPSIALAALTGLALAAAYLATSSPTYVSSATLIIDPRPKTIVKEDSSLNSGPDLALLESQVAIIRSDAVLSRVVESMKLAEDAEFAPPPGQGLGTKVRALLGIKREPVEPQVQALANLAQHVIVKRASKTYVVEIEASSGSPVKAARLAQAVVDAYIADQKSAKSADALQANNLIDSRLGELREQVRQAETRLDQFRKDNKILTSEGGTVGEQQLTRLNAELINARTQAAEAKARLDEVSAATRAGSTDTITDPNKTALLQRLREQLAQVARREASLSSQLLPRHPVLIDIHSQMNEIKSQITNEMKRLAASAKADYQIAASRERELAKELETAKTEVGRTNTAQIKQRELDQEVAASRELLRIFLTRSKETDEQQKISATDARLISPPSVPSRPSKPVPLLIMALGLMGGLAAGIGRALLKDHLDDSLKSPAEVEDLTGLRAIATLPGLKTRASARALTQVRGRPTVIEKSAFGGLARALTNTSGAEEFEFRRVAMSIVNRIRANTAHPHVVMFAAPYTNSGSSTTAFAIAYAAANNGERVLLVDGASAGTRLSDAFIDKLPDHGPIVLDRQDDLSSIISHDTRTGLAFLPIALADLRMLKVAQRKRLLTGLEQLARSYDLVVVDGGGALEDESAAILLPYAREVMLVASSGETEAAALTATFQTLDRARDRITGVILSGTARPV